MVRKGYNLYHDQIKHLDEKIICLLFSQYFLMFTKVLHVSRKAFFVVIFFHLTKKFENIYFIECTFFQNKFAKKWKTHSKKSPCFNTLFKQVAKILIIFNNFLLSYLVYSQMLLNLLVDD